MPTFNLAVMAIVWNGGTPGSMLILYRILMICLSSQRYPRRPMRIVSTTCSLIMTSNNPSISVMLHAIFPSITRLPNVMGPGSSLDSGEHDWLHRVLGGNLLFSRHPSPENEASCLRRIDRLHHLCNSYARLGCRARLGDLARLRDRAPPCMALKRHGSS
jgi:hypothetical protein